WKDDSGQTVQISCPRDAQAVVISLSGTTAEEFTLDGRSNDDTQAWRYRGHQNIKVATDPSAPWAPFLR
ncbi:hypothetical protein, partial [Enterobacter asburiae]|uniref:hypothetical protein n=1 Tax=Enterobacter asburiae TaxID=61645 RepID=UPI0013D0F657